MLLLRVTGSAGLRRPPAAGWRANVGLCPNDIADLPGSPCRCPLVSCDPLGFSPSDRCTSRTEHPTLVDWWLQYAACDPSIIITHRWQTSGVTKDGCWHSNKNPEDKRSLGYLAAQSWWQGSMLRDTVTSTFWLLGLEASSPVRILCKSQHR